MSQRVWEPLFRGMLLCVGVDGWLQAPFLVSSLGQGNETEGAYGGGVEPYGMWEDSWSSEPCWSLFSLWEMSFGHKHRPSRISDVFSCSLPLHNLCPFRERDKRPTHKASWACPLIPGPAAGMWYGLSFHPTAKPSHLLSCTGAWECDHGYLFICLFFIFRIKVIPVLEDALL